MKIISKGCDQRAVLANVILDEEAGQMLDEQSGITKGRNYY